MSSYLLGEIRMTGAGRAIVLATIDNVPTTIDNVPKVSRGCFYLLLTEDKIVWGIESFGMITTLLVPREKRALEAELTRRQR